MEFKNVSFSYPDGNGEQILKNINITINPGETFAILGATGCGKSTFINLIPRFYDVTEGSVLVDGMDVREYPLDKLRDKVAITLQYSELFTTTIKDNIRWGNMSATDSEIKKAADIAQAQEFISGKEDGFDTVVAERGRAFQVGRSRGYQLQGQLLKRQRFS